jgi:5-methylcytosine-specific restriction endonuclease McrA
LVLKRDGYRCRRCGKDHNLQWCHIYSRRYITLRWNPDNALTLCSGCHLWQHHNPLDAGVWVEKTIGEGTANWLRLRMKTPGKIDKKLMLVWLKEMLSR